MAGIKQILHQRGWEQVTAGAGSAEYVLWHTRRIIQVLDGGRDWAILTPGLRQIESGTGAEGFRKAYARHIPRTPELRPEPRPE